MAKLFLRKCAYIFDWSNSTYFYGTKEQHKRKYAINQALKAYYEDPEQLATALDYTIDENGCYCVMINGENHKLNDIQILKTDIESDYINHRRIIDRDSILKDCNKYFHAFVNDDLYSNKFRSFRFEFYTKDTELGYIRVHFNGNVVRFAIDDRTGELLNSGESGKYKPITRKYLIDCLGISSAAALKEFNTVMDIITKG